MACVWRRCKIDDRQKANHMVGLLSVIYFTSPPYTSHILLFTTELHSSEPCISVTKVQLYSETSVELWNFFIVPQKKGWTPKGIQPFRCRIDINVFCWPMLHYSY